MNPPLSAISAIGFNEYFKQTPRLGLYSVLQLNLHADYIETQIVIEQDAEWIEKSVNAFFKAPVRELSLEKIEKFLFSFSQKINTTNLADHLGLWGNRSSDVQQVSRLFYFDDFKNSPMPRSLTLSILAQVLFERYTRFETRIIPMVLRQPTDEPISFGLIVQNPIAPQQYFYFDPVFPPNGIHRRELKSLLSNRHQFLTEAIRISHPQSQWNDKAKWLNLIDARGRELTFKLSGRTPTEKRIAKESKIVAEALPQELVPIEIYFLPYYRPLGHTSLRIGGSLYELSMKGWKVHGQGADSARAFLFNNPFFKNQYSMLRRFGMSPVSIGATIRVSKAQADRLHIILENLVAARGRQAQRFNILTNNCNQGIMRVLSEAGIPGFITKGYLGFSSVLSFRRLLLESPHSIEALHVYPLPNIEYTEKELRRWIPGLIYRRNSVPQELVRAVPRYFHNIAYTQYFRAKQKIVRLFSSKPEIEVQ